MAKRTRWEIVYEDEYLMVINKPAGMLSIPDRYDPDIENLADSLRSYRGDIFINHRLDKDTSGLIVFSKTEDSHRKMQAMFEEGQILKKYRAIVIGHMVQKEGEFVYPLKYDKSRKKTIVHPAGKASLTTYKVMEAWRNYSYVDIRIETGRTHQIRAHFSYVGHPVLCDPLYGNGRPFLLSEIKRNYRHNKDREERPLISRTALHAGSLGFRHPFSGNDQMWTIDPPRDMNAVVRQLSKLESD